MSEYKEPNCGNEGRPRSSDTQKRESHRGPNWLRTIKTLAVIYAALFAFAFLFAVLSHSSGEDLLIATAVVAVLLILIPTYLYFAVVWLPEAVHGLMLAVVLGFASLAAGAAFGLWITGHLG